MKRKLLYSISLLLLPGGLIASRASAQQNKPSFVDKVNMLHWHMAEAHPVEMRVPIGRGGRHLAAKFTADQRYSVWKHQKRNRKSDGTLPYRVLLGQQSSERNYIKAMERATAEIRRSNAEMGKLFP